MKKIISKLFRFWYVNFNRNKLKFWLATRKGECLNCGRCCIELGCPAFDTKNKLCKIRDFDGMINCKPYPWNPYQRLDGCGFYWEKPEDGD